MSSTSKNAEEITSQQKQSLSHYVNRELKESNGGVSVESVVFSAAAVIDILPENAEQIIVEGDEYNIRKGAQGDEDTIISVSTIGSEPEPVTDYFGELSEESNFDSLTEVGTDTRQALKSEFDSLEEVTQTDPETLAEVVNDSLAGKEFSEDDLIAELSSGESGEILAPLEADELAKVIDNPRDLLMQDHDEIAKQTSGTLTPVMIRKVQELYEGRATVLDESDAEEIILESEVNLPAGKRIAEKAMARHRGRKQTLGEAQASVKRIEDEDQTVGDPIADKDVRGLPDGSLEANYVSDIRYKDGNGVNTGLSILEDVGYDQVPKTEEHPDAGHEALPTGENGDVIKPTVPYERDLNLPVDEILAKKMARGVPVRLWGPKGSGKNYIVKYICHATNRGYRNVVANERMEPADLFGPVTPNRDGVIEPRNSAVKQGLLAGDTIVIDEANTMHPGTLTALHQLLNENKIVIPSHGEEIEPHPQACVLLLMNPPTPEYRGAEPLNSATRGRLRSIYQDYPDSVEDEVRTIDQQVNRGRKVVKRDTIERIVDFAHRTRRDNGEQEKWPTLSTRAITIVTENIDDGAAPEDAMKSVIRNSAGRRQKPDKAIQSLGDQF